MTDPIDVRRLGAGDASLVERAGKLFDTPPRPDATQRFLWSADHHLLVAFDGEEPVGFVSGVELTHPDKGVEMFVYELGVDEAARGKGVGTALVEALAALARERGCRGMWVLTDEDNAAAVATYRRAGASRAERTFLLEWTL
jgi:ribosomal protein S18 acetylase RimI-like enzyme